jgi:hypothetical protein
LRGGDPFYKPYAKVSSKKVDTSCEFEGCASQEAVGYATNKKTGQRVRGCQKCLLDFRDSQIAKTLAQGDHGPRPKKLGVREKYLKCETAEDVHALTGSLLREDVNKKTRAKWTGYAEARLKEIKETVKVEDGPRIVLTDAN